MGAGRLLLLGLGAGLVGGLGALALWRAAAGLGEIQPPQPTVAPIVIRLDLSGTVSSACMRAFIRFSFGSPDEHECRLERRDSRLVVVLYGPSPRGKGIVALGEIPLGGE